MKTVTIEELLEAFPLDLYDPMKRILEIAGDKEKLSALEILQIENFSPLMALKMVLREELIDGSILHEFGCRCAERALALVKNPDPRSVEGIAVKRRWVRREARDEEFVAAWLAAGAASKAAAKKSLRTIRKAKKDTANANAFVAFAAKAAARPGAEAAARRAARYAATAAKYVTAAAEIAETEAQVKMLREMLEGETENDKERRNA